jgi:hypothetical protein
MIENHEQAADQFIALLRIRPRCRSGAPPQFTGTFLAEIVNRLAQLFHRLDIGISNGPNCFDQDRKNAVFDIAEPRLLPEVLPNVTGIPSVQNSRRGRIPGSNVFQTSIGVTAKTCSDYGRRVVFDLSCSHFSL